MERSRPLSGLDLPETSSPDDPAPARPSVSAQGGDSVRAPLIRIEAVTKRFGATLALDGVSLDIFEREFFCLLGPSGCGKSTLMRLIAGFEAADAGDLSLAGESLADVPAHRRPVNMMFQSYALFPHMTVAGNIAYGLKQERLGRDEIASRVEEMLRLVQLEGFGSRRPDRLSGGQRQRVALARALAKRPKVLLLDEPLAALDKKLRQETQFELMELQARLGTTFVMVTHDQDEAMTMASRIAVMDRGRVVQVGTPAQIYDAPRNRFVAGFVGEVNLFPGRVVSGEGGCWRVASELSAEPFVVEGPGCDLAPGQDVSVAVRPERMRLSEASQVDRRNRLEGEVAEISYLGDRTFWRVRLPGGEVVRVARSNTRPADAAGIGRDCRVHLSFPPDAAVLLED